MSKRGSQSSVSSPSLPKMLVGMNIIMHVSDLYEIIGSKELGNDGKLKIIKYSLL
jgi:hypothetical protein